MWTFKLWHSRAENVQYKLVPKANKMDNQSQTILFKQAILDAGMVSFLLGELKKLELKEYGDIATELLEIKSQMYLMRSELDHLKRGITPAILKSYKKKYSTKIKKK